MTCALAHDTRLPSRVRGVLARSGLHKRWPMAASLFCLFSRCSTSRRSRVARQQHLNQAATVFFEAIAWHDMGAELHSGRPNGQSDALARLAEDECCILSIGAPGTEPAHMTSHNSQI